MNKMVIVAVVAIVLVLGGFFAYTKFAVQKDSNLQMQESQSTTDSVTSVTLTQGATAGQTSGSTSVQSDIDTTLNDINQDTKADSTTNVSDTDFNIQ